jgi:MFS family permease
MTGRLGIARLIPPNRDERLFSLMLVIDALGTGTLFSTIVIYFNRSYHMSSARIGAGLTIASVVALAGAVPAGRAGDRYGHREVIIACAVARGVLYLVLLAVHGFVGFALTMSLIKLAEVGATPCRRAYLTQLVGSERRVVVNGYNRSVFNLGLAVGGAIAALCLALSSTVVIRWLIVFNAASYFVAAVVGLLLPRLRGEVPAKQASRWLFDWRYLMASMLWGTNLFQNDVLAVVLPLWIVLRTDAPPALAATVLVINTAVVVLFQVRASRGIGTLDSAWTAIARYGVTFLAACVVCLFSHGVPALVAAALLVIATVGFSIGELWASAAGWLLSYNLADPGRQGEYLGMWQLGSTAVSVVGPALVTVLVLQGGAVGWVALGLVFLLAALLLAVGGRRGWAGVDRSRSQLVGEAA